MCRNLIFVSLSPSGARIPSDIFESLFESALYNNDGFALWYMLADYKSDMIRTLSLYRYAKALLSMDNDNTRVLAMHTHQRAASSGSIALNNVHLWQYNDILFSHNGFVYKYCSTGNCFTEDRHVDWRWYSSAYAARKLEGDSDSKKFFEANAPAIERYFNKNDPEAIRKICSKELLTGIVMLTDSLTGKCMAIGVGRSAYMYIANDNTWIAVSNTAIPELEGAREIQCEWTVAAPPFSGEKPLVMYKKARKLKLPRKLRDKDLDWGSWELAAYWDYW